MRVENGSYSGDDNTSERNQGDKRARGSTSGHTNSRMVGLEQQHEEEHQTSMGDMWNVFKNYLHRQGNASFWPLESDLLYNWRYYMIDGNPEYLSTKSKRRLGKTASSERNFNR